MDNHATLPLYPLLIVSILAFLIPILTSWFSKASKLPVPAVVGEVVCGIIIGKSCLGLIESTDSIAWLSFLSLFGFTYLMFLSGLEIDFGLIASESRINRMTLVKRKFLNQPLFQAISFFFIVLLISSVVAIILFFKGLVQSWFIMALILSTTSVSVVVPIIKDKMLSKTRLGQLILISALTSNFMVMLLITIVIAGHTQTAGFSTFTIILLLGIFVFIAHKLHLSRSFDSFIKKLYFFKPIINELSSATTQIRVRGAIALMVLFIVMSQWLGFEVILGAFLAGLITTIILGEAKTSRLEMKLDAIGYGFFIPVFFISVGIDIDLHVFFNSDKAWVILVLLVLFAFANKIIASLIFTFSHTLKESISAGVLLSARLCLIIAASTIAFKQGLISEEVNAAVVMVAVITCISAPIMFNRLYERKKEEKKERITIIGSDYLGRLLAEELLNQKQDVILSATNNQEYEDAKKRGLPVVKYGKNIYETLINLDINKTRTLITTTDKDDFNISICLTARNTFGVRHLMSIVNSPENEEMFYNQKIEPVNKIVSTVGNIVNRLIAPDALAMLSGQEEEIRIADVWLTNTAFNGIPLNTIKLPGDTLVVHIKREQEAIIPHGSTIIYLNDHLTLAGTPKFVIESIELLGIPPEQYCPVSNNTDT